ncbi:MAG: HD-GYP domain-containing protein [Lachnospiraceae bacterium]|nr:HD-GYP domain-containing protein [Lachnospiraceae bacterium]
MRFVPMKNAVPGMALGRDLYDGDGRLLLAKHLLLTEEFIKTLLDMGFPGVYVDDELTKEVIIQEVISPQIRREVVKSVRDMFLQKDLTEKVSSNTVKLHKMVTEVIEEILSNGDIMYNMVDLRDYDNYTYFHSVNVAVLSAMIGASYGMNREELTVLTTGALLHDIGKKFLDIDVLNAPRELSFEEANIIKEHPKAGYEFLRENYNFPTRVFLGVLEHHENYNGTGYPLGKSGEDITIEARIIKIADVYDAMVSKRPYHEPASPAEIVEYIMARTGTKFDPEIVSLFLKKIAVYPVGCQVELSTGESAIVMENFRYFPLRPKIKIMESAKTVNLMLDEDARNITILKLIM